MIAVFGRGFGLYAHMPALAELGRDVHLPARYRPAFEERPELQPYRSAVHFVDQEATLLAKADLAVLARRPAENDSLARLAALMGHPPQLVIEKPPAPTPQAALALDSALDDAGVSHATPYLIEHCDWARDWKDQITAACGAEITVDWRFSSPNASESWKATPENGGGSLNYYFIHLIAFAGFLLGKYCLVECWATAAEGPDSNIGMVAVNGPLRFKAAFYPNPATAEFSAKIAGGSAICAATPFGDVPTRGHRDPRIDALKNFYTSEVFTGASDPLAQERRRQTLKSWAELSLRLHPGNYPGSGDQGAHENRPVPQQRNARYS